MSSNAKLSKNEKTLLRNVTERDQELCLKNIHAAVSNIWSPSAGLVVQDFTDHGPKHYERIAGYANDLIATNKSAPLTSTEAFLLMAGIYLHDVGMQRDVTTDEGKEILDIARSLGGTFNITFTAKTTSQYSVEEQKEIRKNHQYLSAAWIQYAHQKRKTSLGTVLDKIDGILIPDLMDICKYHTGLQIDECPMYLDGGENGRKRVVAALLRFADELDISSNRVNIEAVTEFSVNKENEVFWWLHNLTKVTFQEPGVIRVTVNLNTEDFDEFENVVTQIYLGKFRKKNEKVIEILTTNSFNFHREIAGGVQKIRVADRLPMRVREALHELYASMTSPKDPSSGTPESGTKTELNAPSAQLKRSQGTSRSKKSQGAGSIHQQSPDTETDRLSIATQMDTSVPLKIVSPRPPLPPADTAHVGRIDEKTSALRECLSLSEELLRSSQAMFETLHFLARWQKLGEEVRILQTRIFELRVGGQYTQSNLSQIFPPIMSARTSASALMEFAVTLPRSHYADNWTRNSDTPDFDEMTKRRLVALIYHRLGKSSSESAEVADAIMTIRRMLSVGSNSGSSRQALMSLLKNQDLIDRLELIVKFHLNTEANLLSISRRRLEGTQDAIGSLKPFTKKNDLVDLAESNSLAVDLANVIQQLPHNGMRPTVPAIWPERNE